MTPDPTADNTLMTDYDAMRGLFSYGWGLCGTNHAHMRVFADEAGWPWRPSRFRTRRRSGEETCQMPGVSQRLCGKTSTAQPDASSPIGARVTERAATA